MRPWGALHLNELSSLLHRSLPYPCFLRSSQVLTEMVKEWHQMDGFQKYIQDTVLPASFDTLFRPHFDPRDAKANAVVLEVANLHKAMLAAYNAVFLQVMKTIIASLVPDETACVQFLTQLQNAPVKAYKNCLRELVHIRRRAEGA